MKLTTKLIIFLMIGSSLYMHGHAIVFGVVPAGLYIMRAIDDWGFEE